MRVAWLLVALLALALAWIWFFPDHRKLVGEQLEELSTDAGITKKTTRVYKWRNTDGEWQLTDHPPPAGVEYEHLDYHEDLNVLPIPPQLAGD